MRSDQPSQFSDAGGGWSALRATGRCALGGGAYGTPLPPWSSCVRALPDFVGLRVPGEAILDHVEAQPADSPNLSDDVVLLRPIALSDIESYVARQDDEMARRFEWSGPASVEDVRGGVSRWVESWRSGGSERNFAIVDPATGDMIGDCELELRDDGFVNVMYAVFNGWRRRGVATRAVRLLAQHAAEVFPGHSLLFRIHPDNEGSKGVAQAVGAELAGTERSRSGLALERWVATLPASARGGQAGGPERSDADRA